MQSVKTASSRPKQPHLSFLKRSQLVRFWRLNSFAHDYIPTQTGAPRLYNLESRASRSLDARSGRRFARLLCWSPSQFAYQGGDAAPTGQGENIPLRSPTTLLKQQAISYELTRPPLTRSQWQPMLLLMSLHPRQHPLCPNCPCPKCGNLHLHPTPPPSLDYLLRHHRRAHYERLQASANQIRSST